MGAPPLLLKEANKEVSFGKLMKKNCRLENCAWFWPNFEIPKSNETFPELSSNVLKIRLRIQPLRIKFSNLIA